MGNCNLKATLNGFDSRRFICIVRSQRDSSSAQGLTQATTKLNEKYSRRVIKWTVQRLVNYMSPEAKNSRDYPFSIDSTPFNVLHGSVNTVSRPFSVRNQQGGILGLDSDRIMLIVGQEYRVSLMKLVT